MDQQAYTKTRCPWASVGDEHSPIHFWCSLWVETVVACVLIVSAFSAFSLMHIGAWISFFSGLAWSTYRIAEYRPQFIRKRSIKENPLYYILASTCLISVLAGPHCFLDSYSYRIPQMLFWLQEGHPWSVPNADMRINQIPHVWSFLSSAFFLPFGEIGIAIPNFISFLIMAGILKCFAHKATPDPAKATWLVMIFISAPVFVMGSATNDNVVTCVTFLAISFYFALLEKPSTRSIGYSALAFALCCGIKPQYVTLAPLWALWFFFGKPNPAKQFKWLTAVILLPLVIICSPLPTLGINYFNFGSVNHPQVLEQKVHGSVVSPAPQESQEMEFFGTPLGHSIASLTTQMLALPVNPMADMLTQRMRSAAKKYKSLKYLDWHRQRILPLVIPEVASFGFFTTAAFLTGIFLSLRYRRHGGAAVAVSAVALLAAIYATNPGTLGRSFIGFFIVMVPFSFLGLASLKMQTLRITASFCFLSGILLTVLNPARPLWPCGVIAKHIPHKGVRGNILDYAHYSKRQYAAAELIQSIPREKAHTIGTIIQYGEPIAELWKPYNTKRKIRTYSASVSRKQLLDDGVLFIIVRNNLLSQNSGAVPSSFLDSLDGKIRKVAMYTSYMQKGPEPWILIEIKP